MRVWSKNPFGEDNITSIKQKGIGAIYLGNEIAQFHYNNHQNETLGKLRASGHICKRRWINWQYTTN